MDYAIASSPLHVQQEGTPVPRGSKLVRPRRGTQARGEEEEGAEEEEWEREEEEEEEDDGGGWASGESDDDDERSVARVHRRASTCLRVCMLYVYEKKPQGPLAKQRSYESRDPAS